MRNDVTWRHQNLMWTASGTVWGMWRLQPRPYGFADPREKDRVRAQHQELFQAIRGEGLLLGLSSQMDDRTVGERMMHEVRMDQCLAHRNEVELTLEGLEEVDMGRRAYFFAAPLTRVDVRARLAMQAKAAYGLVRDAVGARRIPPSRQETLSALIAANHVQQALPATFEARPVTIAEQSWVYAHQMMRGLPIDIPEPEEPAEGIAEAGFVPGAGFGDPLLDEGGVGDLENSLKRFNPFNRRFLKVQSPHAEQASYQVLLGLTGTPAGGWLFPGVEWLSWCDQFPVDIDWAVRLHVYDSETARTKNKHAEQGLDDQLTQLSGDNAITGGQMELERNVQLLHEYHSELSADEREVEVQPTVILSVASDSAEQAMSDASVVSRAFRAQSFILEPICGEQESLWWSMLPGTATQPIVRQIAQLTTGKGMSSTVPLVSYDLGDADGVFLGFNRSTHKPLPVFLNLHGATQSNQSGCVAVVGDLGKGKSVILKKIAGSAFDRGGVLVIVDRSEPMEYATFAQSLAPESTAVVEILRPAFSLDPLRVFGPGKEGARLALALLNSLLDLDPLSAEGAYLSNLLATDDGDTLRIASLRELRDQIAADKSPHAADVVGRMNVYARHQVGQVLFDDTIPALSLTNRAIVFCTRGLELPTNAEMQSTKLAIEKRFGLRMTKYLAAIGRAICFADPSTFALFLSDEVRAMAEQADAREELVRFVLEGRKSAAAIALGGQTVSQLGGEDLWGLIPTRIVCGHSDPVLAREAAAWVGWDPEVEANVKAIQDLSPRDPRHPRQEVPEHRRGEIILRDPYTRVGPARVLLPFEPARRKAIQTTPPRPGQKEAA